MKKFEKFLILSILSVLFLSLFVLEGRAATVAAPTIVAAEEKNVDGVRELEVRGLAPAHTDVLIYINLQVAGLAQVSKENDDLSSFYYHQVGDLPVGEYKVAAVARDQETYLVSPFSPSISLEETEAPRPIVPTEIPKVIPPTLLRSIVDDDSSYNQPKLIGQALGGTRVDVYIDGRKDGSLLISNEQPGTVQFEYIVNREMTPGQHVLYLYAFDDDNNRSEQSNLIYVNVIAEDAGRINAEEMETTDLGVEVPIEEPATKEVYEDDQVLQEILEYSPVSSTTESSGLIDEEKEQQSQVKLNLFIFLLFLTAIILWIFWVNRELVREKDDENDDNDKKDGGPQTPIGDIDSPAQEKPVSEAEYGLDKKKKELDVLDF